MTGLADNPSDHYRITIYDLRRSGPYVTLDFGIVCTQSHLSSCFGETDFSGEGLSGLSTAGGVALVDPQQKKWYTPVRDSRNQPYTSQTGGVDVGPTVHLAWATFAAPPASVSAMDVVFPDGGPQVPGIPITTGGPPSLSGVGPNVVPAKPATFDRPADPHDTTGLTLPVSDLVSTVGTASSSDAEAPGHTTITLSADVLFAFAKADLTPAAQGSLATVAAKIKAGGNGTVTVAGYTDSVGPDSVNVPLSRSRAQAVVTALGPQVAGAPVSFNATGMGAADPVAPNTKGDNSDNPAGRALNRRVTISYNITANAPQATPPPAPAPAPATPSPQPVE